MMKGKKILALLIALLVAVSMTACGSSGGTSEKKEGTSKESAASFDDMVKKAKGTTVTFYGWGGDDLLNSWLDDYFAPRMQKKYGIKMKRVPMNIEDILSQLSVEKQSGKKKSDIDMIWINGENFKTARENGFLYGPFLDKLPNYGKYYNAKDRENNYDFSYPIKGYEAPYGKAQVVFEVDRAKVKSVPTDTKAFAEFVKKNPGKVTYPAPPDFTGSVFVRNVIYDICGYKQFQNMKADKETVRKAVEPAMKYLKSLNPYLWNKGKTFPESSQKADKMFADGETIFRVTYDAYDISKYIENGTFPKTADSFQFKKGTIGNTNYMAIAKNSGNVAGAMVAINEMMSPEVQLNRYEKLHTVPVTDNSKLTKAQKDAFAKVDLGKGTIPQAQLLSKRLPEMPSALVPIIEEIWEEEVAGK